VNIIWFVAAITFDRGVFVVIGYVTFFTGYNGMQANQWEAGYIMVKPDLAAPAFFIMAVVTLLTLLTFMYVINLVAAIAVGFRLGFIDMFFVA